jgi:hypothetical protein
LARGFARQKLDFAFDSPAVAAQATIFPDHSVAWNHDGDWIGGAGAIRGPQLASDLSIRSGTAVRYGTQRCPDATLKGGGANVDRQVEMRLAAVEMPYQDAGPFAQRFVIALDPCSALFAPEDGHQRLIRVTDADGAHAFLGSTDQEPAQ